MKPSVGRIVHYVSGEGVVHRAALITAIDEEDPYVVSATVFNPPNIQPPIQHVEGIDHVEVNVDSVERSWHWPERVED